MSIYNGIFGVTHNHQVKRNVFISYYHGDQVQVNEFVRHFGRELDVFTPCMLAEGERFTDDIINSTNPQYVMQQIRQRYFGHSTVTIVLVGNCTHSRRYVDWEIKASLQQGGVGGQMPHGLIAINLDRARNSQFLPPRLLANFSPDGNAYAHFYGYPASGDELRNWIEDAFAARTSRRHLIKNSNDMMKYNSRCNICGVTH
ncbi:MULTISPECIES: TIR domain-containing protein [Photobacterium]|uniref:TIR domain-containing protein n=1 Tax=Photobacterium TaxID=657 RepID=UPI000D17958A|nr:MULTISPECIES: TIR domain-containing protein [Photobacterium]PSV54716.1 hypothetical protein C9J45_03970 [Photobacterium sp. GB-1]